MKSPQRKTTAITRREFAGIAAGAIASVVLGDECQLLAGQGASIELGVCQSLNQAGLIKKAGFQYIEGSVGGQLAPLASDAEFEKQLEKIKASPLPMRACNGFIPGNMKLVGPDVNMEALLKFAETAFQRAEKAGVKRIVLGSGGARKIPEGFDASRAREQFVDFGKKIAPLAQAHGVIVILEALNRGETNFINRVDEGLPIIEAINHPGFQMHADFYHMLREDEGPESIIKAGPRLQHCHVAEKKTRSAPGVAGDDFRPYFKALKTIGYKGGVSIECGWKDFPSEVEKACEVLREQLASA